MNEKELFEVKDEKGKFYCYIYLETRASNQYVDNLIKKIFNDNLDCEEDFSDTFEKEIIKINKFKNIQFFYKKQNE